MQDALAFSEELDEVALALNSLDLSPGKGAASRTASAIIDEYQRLDMAAAMFDMQGVQATSSWVSDMLESLLEKQPEAVVELLSAGQLASWIQLTAIAIKEPEEIGHLSAITASLMHESWPDTPKPELLEKLLLSLRMIDESVVEQSSESENAPGLNQSNLSSGHLDGQTLDWDADIHPELLDAYLQETPGLIAESATLIRLIAAGKNADKDLAQAARIVHTVKGASAVVGVEPIARFSHRLEDLFEFDITQYLEKGLNKTLEASADCLEALFDNLQESKTLPKSYSKLLGEIDGWTQQISAQQTDDTSGPKLDAIYAQAMESPRVKLPDFIAQSGAEVAEDDEPLAASKRKGGAAFLNVPLASVQTLLNLAGELITSTSQIAEQANTALEYGRRIRSQEEHVREMLDELSEAIDKQHELRQDTKDNISDEFEQLELEVYNDLHSLYGLLNESIADNSELTQTLHRQVQQLSEQVYQQQRMQRRLSETVLSTRLVAVKTLVARLERTVRETCRSTGKQASIKIIGQNQKIDTGILRNLTPALLHLLRNAVDHGIESPEQRKALGKPEEGKIELSFVQKGNIVHLSLQDDGRGLDAKVIRARAIEQSIITADQVLNEEEVLRLVLRAGFTTQDQVTEISGRGVGMDVVQNAVENLQGFIRLNSTPGKGMSIEIQVPLTLVSTNAMLVRASGNIVAIPVNTVNRLLYVPTEELVSKDNRYYITHDKKLIEVMQLATLLGWPIQASEQKGYSVMLIETASGLQAVQVEELLQPRDIVVKDLAAWFEPATGISGACILANGEIATVLDPLRLLRNFERGVVQIDRARTVASRQKAITSKILIVDDSLSNRKSLSLMVEKMGYEAVTAVDGLDALQQLNTQTVEMILLDLEMPRMNGLEMAQSVRNWPEQQHLPIVMITSRSTQKHREMAKLAGIDDYLTKPVEQKTLSTLLNKWLRTQLAS